MDPVFSKELKPFKIVPLIALEAGKNSYDFIALQKIMLGISLNRTFSGSELSLTVHFKFKIRL